MDLFIKNEEDMLNMETKKSRASQLRDANLMDFTVPSGVEVTLRALDDETLVKILPFFSEQEDEGTKRSDLEYFSELQAIIVPRHFADPKVVESLEEEAADPENLIYIKNIPLFDRIAVAMYILGMDQEFIDNLLSDRQRERSEKFRGPEDLEDGGDSPTGVAPS
jgi:hypothetical protein